MKSTLGQYTVESELGRGGMGIVYRGLHESLGRAVAIKALAPDLTRQPEFRDRFFSEAKTQARLQHPNIVAVYDLLEDEGEYFIVMELVTGTPLDDRLQEAAGRGMAIGEAVAIGAQMLSALDYAHSEGVIHRDIKPSNVLVAPGGRVKLMDFGIALLIGDKRLTASQSTIGTPSYMSPEQILRPRDVDHRTDIYSAGVVLYEMLAGRPPFDDDTEYGIKKLHVEVPPPDLHGLRPDAPPALIDAIAVALAKSPDERFASAGLFQRAVSEAVPAASDSGVSPVLPPTPPRPTTVERYSPAATTAGTGAPEAAVSVAQGRGSTPAPGAMSSLEGFLTHGRGRWVALAAAVVILFGLAGMIALSLGGDEVAEVTSEASDRATGPGVTEPELATPVVPAAVVMSEDEVPDLAAAQGASERVAHIDPEPRQVQTARAAPTQASPQRQPATPPRTQPAAKPAPVVAAQTTPDRAAQPTANLPDDDAAAPPPQPAEQHDSSAENSLDEFAQMDDLVVSIERLGNQTLDAYEAEGRDDKLLERLDQFVDAAEETRKEFRKVTGTGLAGIKANVRGLFRRNRGGGDADRRVLELKVENLSRRAGEIDGLIASASPAALTVELWQELRQNLRQLEGYF